MVDTLELELNRITYPGVNFLEETTCYLDEGSRGTHCYNDGGNITGRIGPLSVSINEFKVKIYKGSLCKWFLGSNLHTMTRKDIKNAIDKLSDTLHLPMKLAKVTRLDIAENFIMKHPTDVYLNHLGEFNGLSRCEQPDGLLYKDNDGNMELCLYNKLREQKKHREEIPSFYDGKNILRYEIRYKKAISKHFKVEEVTAGKIYNSLFYNNIIKDWEDEFMRIGRLNEICINFSDIRGKKELNRAGVLALLEKAGGQQAFYKMLKEAQKLNKLTRKQACDLRAYVDDICSQDQDVIVENDTINELQNKVKEVALFCR